MFQKLVRRFGMKTMPYDLHQNFDIDDGIKWTERNIWVAKNQKNTILKGRSKNMCVPINKFYSIIKKNYVYMYIYGQWPTC